MFGFWEREESPEVHDGHLHGRAAMVEHQLRARGIRCATVLEVMGRIPRERFLSEKLKDRAYQDRALPLALGQTISQPYIVAVMTEALGVQPSHRVLEIGTGSGYQTAILASMAAQVFSIERIQELSDLAARTLGATGFGNVELKVGDGSMGWPEKGPFHRILVTAGAPRAPEALKNQLSEDGGKLVVPVGNRLIQELVQITRRGQEFEREDLMSCRFVPLVGQEGWKAPETPD